MGWDYEMEERTMEETSDVTKETLFQCDGCGTINVQSAEWEPVLVTVTTSREEPRQWLFCPSCRETLERHGRLCRQHEVAA